MMMKQVGANKTYSFKEMHRQFQCFWLAFPPYVSAAAVPIVMILVPVLYCPVLY